MRRRWSCSVFGFVVSAMKRHRKNGASPVCVGAGFVALDVIRSEMHARSELRFAGGSCGNVLTILAFLGWKSSPVARIGQDPPGAQLLRDLQRWSVDTRWVMREQTARTPVVFQEIFSDRKGQPQHRFTRNCFLCGEKAVSYRPVRLRDADLLADQWPPPKVFYFDRVAPGNIELARKAKDAGALVVFEPSGTKDPRLFGECLRLAHVFKYSHERFDAYPDPILGAPVPIVVETRGADGLRVTVRRKGKIVLSEELPAVRAPRVRDAAGSGDWCTAGLIHRLIEYAVPGDVPPTNEAHVVESLRYGQALAALNCAFEGARGVMYSMEKKDLLHGASALAEGEHIEIPEETELTLIKTGVEEGSTCVLCARAL